MKIKITVLVLLSSFIFAVARPPAAMAIEPAVSEQTYQEIDSRQQEYGAKYAAVKRYAAVAAAVLLIVVLVYIVLRMRRA